MKKILFIFGTRPEAIKLAPVIKECSNQKTLKVFVCITAQHRELLDDVLTFFQIIPDYDLDLMKPNQSLSQLTSEGIRTLDKVFSSCNPDITITQGDTTTAFIGSLVSFYHRCPVAHVEAGLRSNNILSPYPEEANRKFISSITNLHFTPTELSKNNLISESITKNIYVVGNTVIDALHLGLETIKNKSSYFYEDFFKRKGVDFNKRILLLTLHRRESYGEAIESISEAIKTIAKLYDDVQIICPLHPNPNIKLKIKEFLNGFPNILLTSPLNYPSFIYLLNKSFIVLSDSGGVQEEAPSLGKPVLVLRNTTERPEAIKAGSSIKVGTCKDVILKNTQNLLDNQEKYQTMATISNPYGKGDSSIKITNHLLKYFITN
ncbi:UDP-N-acetylglucosamine 2-epimerase (non-hydrolyzing) [Candidatus Marinamargulisbacteria bacterium SCGC AG-410-N11]|nr:UDP-N-acetylglucosamine 2-epimerase (non-hydrolyzing) [Candidatus Marinamargulisbacteria bacterium SCGC AG-410-N11]